MNETNIPQLLAQVDKSSFTSNDDRQACLEAINKLRARTETPSETMARWGWMEPCLLASLRICDNIGLFRSMATYGDQSIAVNEQARLCEIDPELLNRILKHLAAMNIISETAPSTYRLTELSRALSKPEMSCVITHLYEVVPLFTLAMPSFLEKTSYVTPADIHHCPMQLGLQMHTALHDFDADRICSNTPPSFWDLLSCHPKIAQNFTNLLRGVSDDVHHGAAHLLLSNRPLLKRLLDSVINGTAAFVDVGGNTGYDIAALADAYPHCDGRYILQDLPDIVAATELRNDPRIQVMAHDFFEPQPAACQGARLYHLHSVLHDWPDDMATKILKQLKDAMTPDYSKILILDIVMKDYGADPFTTALDLTMLAAHAGRERGEADWKALIEGVPGLMLSTIYAGGSHRHETILEISRI